MHLCTERRSVLVNLTRENTLTMIVDISNTNNGGDENIKLVGRIEKYTMTQYNYTTQKRTKVYSPVFFPYWYASKVDNTLIPCRSTVGQWVRGDYGYIHSLQLTHKHSNRNHFYTLNVFTCNFKMVRRHVIQTRRCSSTHSATLKTLTCMLRCVRTNHHNTYKNEFNNTTQQQRVASIGQLLVHASPCR